MSGLSSSLARSRNARSRTRIRLHQCAVIERSAHFHFTSGGDMRQAARRWPTSIVPKQQLSPRLLLDAQLAEGVINMVLSP